MERINRDNYLSILKNFKDQQIIKVITGIRRCGKSTLLEIFQDYLRERGVEDNQIISINFEDADYEELQDRKKLYEYINNLPGQTSQEKLEIFNMYTNNFQIYKNGSMSF